MLFNYRIVFDDTYFNKLKNESQTFKQILNALGISDFTNNQVKNFAYGQYNLELSMKPRNKTINWVIQTETLVGEIMNLKIDFKKLEREALETDFGHVRKRN